MRDSTIGTGRSDHVVVLYHSLPPWKAATRWPFLQLTDSSIRSSSLSTFATASAPRGVLRIARSVATSRYLPACALERDVDRGDAATSHPTARGGCNTPGWNGLLAVRMVGFFRGGAVVHGGVTPGRGGRRLVLERAPFAGIGVVHGAAVAVLAGSRAAPLRRSGGRRRRNVRASPLVCTVRHGGTFRVVMGSTGIAVQEVVDTDTDTGYDNGTAHEKHDVADSQASQEDEVEQVGVQRVLLCCARDRLLRGASDGLGGFR